MKKDPHVQDVSHNCKNAKQALFLVIVNHHKMTI